MPLKSHASLIPGQGRRRGCGERKQKMSTALRNLAAREAVPEHEQKRIALGYRHDAWIQALHDGIEGDCLAQTAPLLVLPDPTMTYGEDAAAATRKTWARASAMANSRSRSAAIPH